MNTFVVVALSVCVISIAAVAYFFIKTLIQAVQTLKSLEILSENLNREVAKLGTVTDAAASAASFLGGGLGKAAALALGLIQAFRAARVKKERDHE